MHKKRAPSVYLKLILTCFLWQVFCWDEILILFRYSSSALTSNLGKQILISFPNPVTLTFIQFGSASLFSFLYGTFVTRNCPIPFSSAAATGGGLVWSDILHEVKLTFPLALFQILGHILSLNALVHVSVSFTHTVKALSPLFTVLFYRTIFKVFYSKQVYLSLLVLISGVALVCANNIVFNWTGFICAITSTIIFVCQNIFSKSLFSAAKLGIENSKKVDKITLLFYSSFMAFILMIPIWLRSEGITNTTTTGNKLSNQSIIYLAFLFLLNGITHFAQALLSFSLLSLVSPITFSIASLIKRIFVITASIFWFGDLVDMTQGAGITLTFCGLYLYHLAEKDVKKGELTAMEYQLKHSAAAPTLPTHDLRSRSD